jgi:hypothetical protein
MELAAQQESQATAAAAEGPIAPDDDVVEVEGESAEGGREGGVVKGKQQPRSCFNY